jgi:hypothetical protein
VVIQVLSGFLERSTVSPRERQRIRSHFDFPLLLATFPKPAGVVWADLFALCPSSLITASSARQA